MIVCRPVSRPAVLVNGEAQVFHAVAQFLGGQPAGRSAGPAVFVVEPRFQAEGFSGVGAGVDAVEPLASEVRRLQSGPRVHEIPAEPHFFIANATVRLQYADGVEETIDLVPPLNFWAISPFGPADYNPASDGFTLAATLPETLTLRLKNTGAMTALFSSMHPLLNYRNDFYLSDNHLSIPPGETRDVTLRAPLQPKDGLTLGQTGWRIETWNAPDVFIEPTLLLAIGRQDRMTREFAGGAGGAPTINGTKVRLAGRLPAASSLPLLMESGRVVEFEFPVTGTPGAAVLRIHTADQSPAGANLRATLNGQTFTAEIPAGLGLQKIDPQHLAKSKTVEIPLPANALRQGDNTLTLELANDGWFTWDALDLM